MNYAELLKNFIQRSNFTLDDISLELEKRGLSASKQYLSRLQNGKNPPASDALNRALAEITGGDIDALLLAGHIEKAPDEVKSTLSEAQKYKEVFRKTLYEIAGKDIDISKMDDYPDEIVKDTLIIALQEAQKYKEIFTTITFLIEYLQNHRSGKAFDKELHRRINIMLSTIAVEYEFYISINRLDSYPEYAAEIIAKLKNKFYPDSTRIRFADQSIDFREFVDEQGEPIFHTSPYPDILNDKEDKEPNDNWSRYRLTHGDIHDENTLEHAKFIFFEELENDLHIDLSDPKVQKQLKRAAKIFFADEE
ncbi:hypothetical protein [Paenibacillus sinopodophylli]|uniref:hypothetical protein n=1 Tax=Paenibacillus sinopodophylli TaxID=1837342 RepID=UPI001BB1EA3B|nr:hypothetical protein [Paenibacillus sinopodophylli]